MAIIGYKVYRDDVLIASPNSSPYVDRTVTNGVSYTYQVSAVSDLGEGPKAGPVTVIPSAASTPGPSRFSLPNTTQTYTVPDSVPHNGSTDATSALQSYVNGVPNGSTIYFPAGYSYRMASHGLNVDGRSNLLLDTNASNPATIKSEGYDIANSQIHAEECNHITIRNLILRGNNPDGGTTCAYHGTHGCAGGGESASGISMFGNATYIELNNVQIYDEWGHGSYTSRGGHSLSPSYVWVHDSLIARVGVMGVAIASVMNMWVEVNTINDTAIYPIDFEDGLAGQPMKNVYIGHNNINRWGWNSYYTGHAIVGDGATGMSWDYVSIDSNTMTGGFQSSPQNGQGGIISFDGSDTKNHLSITNNHGPSGAGQTVTISNAPGAVVSGNTP